MAGAAVLEDSSALSRIDRSLLKIENFFALVAGLVTLSLMVLAVISVSGRLLFNQPLPGYVDWITMALPFIAFLGVSYTQRDGGHIRMDIVVGQFKGRMLWLVEAITATVTLIILLFLIWGAWSHFGRSFDFAAPMWSRDSTIDLNLPIWPTKILVPFMFAILALRMVVQIIGYFRAFFLNLEAPVAVPLMQSVAEQAAAEAAHVDGGRE
jgi:TRAP-type C4-dicarboxylate transport system permease small subunit